MRILAVAQDYPWPVRSGLGLRMENVLSALAAAGAVELFSVVYHARTDPLEPAPRGLLTRSGTATAADPNRSRWERLAWVAGTGPIEVAPRRRLRPLQEEFGRWVDPPYDLVWFSSPLTYHALGRPRLGPTIVDVDDLEDVSIRARLSGPLATDRTSLSLPSRARRAGVRLQAELNARRWERAQRQVVSSVDAVTVCTEPDRARLGPTAHIVGNGYEPQAPVGRVAVGSPPVVMFQGLLHYGPNADAAEWLVGEVGPLLRHMVPDARIRLVGDVGQVVARLHAPPDVTVVGKVPDMVPELRKADVVVVPVRYGSGTRIKILEAFAHRIPVASTTIGAAGLGTVDGRHLLIGDSAEGLATACARLLTDDPLRSALAETAHELFMAQHRWEQMRARMTDLAFSVAGAGSNSGSARPALR